MGAKKRPTDPAGNPWPEHPMFPIDEGQLPPEVAYIQITRFEAGKGQLWAPRMHRGDEIQSLQDIADLYGGGEYELIARGKDPTSGNATTITKKQVWRIAGISRPLGEIPKDAPAQQERGGIDASAIAPMLGGPLGAMLAGGGGRVDPMMLFLILMMEQNKTAEARAERQSQQQMAQMQSSNALLVEAMKASGGNSGALAGALATALGGRRESDPAAMIAALAAAMKPAHDDASPLDLFTAGMQMATKLKGESGDVGLKEVIEGMQAAAGIVQPIMQNETARNELEKEKVKASGAAPTKPTTPPIVAKTPNGAS